MKKILLLLVAIVCMMSASAGRRHELSSMVFEPEHYYQGIESTLPIAVDAVANELTHDVTFTVSYHVNPQARDATLLDSYQYSFEVRLSALEETRAASGNLPALTVTSHQLVDSLLQITGTIHEESPVMPLKDRSCIFALLAARGDTIVASDYALLLMDDGKGNIADSKADPTAITTPQSDPLEPVTFYSLDGRRLATVSSANGKATISSNCRPRLVIVKQGKGTRKVLKD